MNLASLPALLGRSALRRIPSPASLHPGLRGSLCLTDQDTLLASRFTARSRSLSGNSSAQPSPPLGATPAVAAGPGSAKDSPALPKTASKTSVFSVIRDAFRDLSLKEHTSMSASPASSYYPAPSRSQSGGGGGGGGGDGKEDTFWIKWSKKSWFARNSPVLLATFALAALVQASKANGKVEVMDAWAFDESLNSMALAGLYQAALGKTPATRSLMEHLVAARQESSNRASLPAADVSDSELVLRRIRALEQVTEKSGRAPLTVELEARIQQRMRLDEERRRQRAAQQQTSSSPSLLAWLWSAGQSTGATAPADNTDVLIPQSVLREELEALLDDMHNQVLELSRPPSVWPTAVDRIASLEAWKDYDRERARKMDTMKNRTIAIPTLASDVAFERRGNAEKLVPFGGLFGVEGPSTPREAAQEAAEMIAQRKQRETAELELAQRRSRAGQAAHESERKKTVVIA